MAQNVPLAEGDPAIEPFFDAIQEVLSGGAPYLYLELASPTSVRAPAGSGNDQMSLGVDGLYRFRTSAVTAAHPGGAAGTYDVYATASDNDFTGPPGAIDETVYDFGLRVRASGSPPTGVDHYRKVGEVEWDGSAIVALRQLAGHRRDVAPVQPTAHHAGHTPLRARGVAGQTAPLALFESVPGAEVARVGPDGAYTGGPGLFQAPGSTAQAVGVQRLSDTGYRLRARGDGRLDWGPGDGTLGASIGLSGTTLTLTGSLAVTAALTVAGAAVLAAGDAAGGDLSGAWPNPSIAAGAVTDAKVAGANKDGGAAVPSMRTLGTGAAQALAGNARLDQLAAPTGNLSMGSQRVTNVADPTAGQDAATRAWTLAQLAGFTAGQIADGAVTDAKVAAGAAIQLSKLATDPLARANHTGTQLAATISDFNATVRTNRLDQMAAPTSDVSMNSRRITNLLDPAAPQDAASKAYVDVASPPDFKASCKAATTGNVSIASPGTSSFDGVTLSAGDRLLVRAQSTGSQNGIYVFNGPSSALTRAVDADTSAEMTQSLIVAVEQGSTYGDVLFSLTNDSVVLGTTSLNFVAFGYAGGNWAAFGVTPAARPSATAEIKAALVSLGLLRAGPGDLDLDGGRLAITGIPVKPIARISNSGDQTVPSTAVDRVVAFDTLDFQTYAGMKASNHLVAPIDGFYRIVAQLRWEPSTDNQERRSKIRKNGTVDWAYGVGHGIGGGGTIGPTSNCETEMNLLAGDFVELTVDNDTLSNQKIVAVGKGSPVFSIEWLGPLA